MLQATSAPNTPTQNNHRNEREPWDNTENIMGKGAGRVRARDIEKAKRKASTQPRYGLVD
ncbi:hypothetical protein SAMD00023378_3979 [Ralstonia sp. NT80]|nr:hypothetical protein SAMD00023378_3979 [Ralstonia sp. NT80]